VPPLLTEQTSALMLIILRLRNDLCCVGWGVKLHSLTHSLMLITKKSTKINATGQYYYYF